MKIKAEKNFDSGRKNNGEKICLFSEILKNNPNFLVNTLRNDTIQFSKSRLGEFATKDVNYIEYGMIILGDINLINYYIDEFYNLEYLIKSTNKYFTINESSKLQNYKENIINLMKRIVDYIIMLSQIKYLKSQNFKIDSYGLFKRNLDKNYTITAKKDKDMVTFIYNTINVLKFGPLFDIINDLHNSFKHEILTEKTRNIFGKDTSIINAFSYEKGNLDEVVYINCNIAHIIWGFNDFLKDFYQIEVFNGVHRIIVHQYN